MIPVLPFTAEVLDSLIGGYNLALWPLPLLAPVLAVASTALVLARSAWAGRAAAGLLAAAWAWVGVAFQIRTAGQVDFVAPLYGALFVAQAALLAWNGSRRAGLSRVGNAVDSAAASGLGLALLAIVGYPVFALASGRSWSELPIVGLAPDPTVMLTFGLLLIRWPKSWSLLVTPVLWSLVAGVQALSLSTPERLALPVAAVLTIAFFSRPRPNKTSKSTISI